MKKDTLENDKDNLNTHEESKSQESNDTNNTIDNDTEQQAEPTPEEKIAQLEKQIADLKNAMLYKAAEFENYRKRTIKEKADLILNGGKKVIENLLPVIDDLERAEANIEKTTDAEVLREGLQLVFQKFHKTLENLGLKQIDTAGQDFSTDFHEAVAFVPGTDDNKGKVIDCIQKGYILNEQVIRFAKVAVGQ